MAYQDKKKQKDKISINYILIFYLFMVRAGRNKLSFVSNASFNTIGVTYTTCDTDIGFNDFWQLKKVTNKTHCHYGGYICNCIPPWKYKKKRLTVVDPISIILYLLL